jgi:hypothetical protein
LNGILIPTCGATWHSPHLKSVSDFRIVIAIAIPIKNRSGKNADRFSFDLDTANFIPQEYEVNASGITIEETGSIKMKIIEE